jgi:hypothetical protein
MTTGLMLVVWVSMLMVGAVVMTMMATVSVWVELMVGDIRFVEYITHSIERVFSSSCSSVVWAVDSLCASFIARERISGVTAVVWVLDVAQVVIFRLFASGVVAVFDGDVAVAWGGSRCGTGGWGTSWGWLGRLGGVLEHHLGR